MVKMHYNEIGNFGFQNAFQKIMSTPTHGQKASTFHHMDRQIQEARKMMHKQFQSTLIEKFAKRDESGKIVRPPGQPDGFDIIDEKQEEFLKEQEAFGATVIELGVSPLTLDLMSDVKLSGDDLKNLKSLYVGNHEAPADNVMSIVGAAAK